MDMRFVSYPMNFALRGLPADAPRWGPRFKAMLSERFTHTVNASGHTTSLPVETNSISLDPHVKDAWGLQAVRVTYKDHPEDMKTMAFFQERCKELLEAAGPLKVWTRELRNQSFGFHLLGTCRMGDDPRSSVVDKYHRAHDVSNLFICDGSSFVTSGRGQPTCTMQALAFRASDHIIRMAKNGDIKSGV